jgi:hypothetical protein
VSWDIFLFNTKQKANSVEDIDDKQLSSINFCEIFLRHFQNIKKDENHREIIGLEFSIEYFEDEELVNNKMVSIYGENGLFELIELAKKYNWLIFDTGIGEMIDLKNPSRNGYENHQKYVRQILNDN